MSTLTIEPAISTPAHSRVPFGVVTAAEKAEKLILRWYQVTEFSPREEWDIFAVATKALIHIEEHGVVSFIESKPPALPEPVGITKTIWLILQGFARRAMTITRTPWTGGAYMNAERQCTCECPEDDSQGCYRTCKCRCDDHR